MGLHRKSATELRDLLRRGETCSVDIVRALRARAEAVDGEVNAFVLRLHEEAERRAAELDALSARGERPGPLHGLPVTVKESLDVAGTDATLGLRRRQGHPAERDAVVVEALRAAGAVVLGKTNVPQLLLAQETENALFGTTRNPWSLEHVPGGSSGGEAAAIASGQSPLGVGTDIGGSIRIPAHFCGIFGFKPTVDRWSNRGSHTGIPGQELVRSQVGPLARSTADLRLMWTALDPRSMALRDPRVPPLPAGDPEKVSLEGMRVGCFDDDGFMAPTAALRRAVHEACAALEAAGAEVISFRPEAGEEIVYLWLGAISSDGGAVLGQQLAGEEISAQLAPSRKVASLPGLLRAGLAGVLRMKGERRLAELLRVLGSKPVEAFWRCVARRTELRLIELDRWRSAGLDAMICPAHVLPAMGHRESGDLTLTLGYCFRYTLLNFPAGIVPVTRVRPEEARAGRQGDRLDRKIAGIEARSAGLPVGVQVVARPFREDVALAVMEAVEAGVRGSEGFPTTPVDP